MALSIADDFQSLSQKSMTHVYNLTHSISFGENSTKLCAKTEGLFSIVSQDTSDKAKINGLCLLL